MKMRKRVFTIDHADGSETTVTVCGPAGGVKCSSTEQSVQIWTGDAPMPLAAPTPGLQVQRGAVVAHSSDVSRSGQEYTITDTLDGIRGGLPEGMTEDEAWALQASDPDSYLEKMRVSIIQSKTEAIERTPGEN
jgi:hypothetical protein